MEQGNYALGIDLGTSYTSASVWLAGKQEPTKVRFADNGWYKIPSVVYYSPTEVITGQVAYDNFLDSVKFPLQEQIEIQDNTILNLKRELSDDQLISLGSGRIISHEQVFTDLLSAVKKEVEEVVFQGKTVDRVVLTHPIKFTQSQLKVLRSAAEKTGFTEIELLPEPVAAALGFRSVSHLKGNNILVYDFGGGTFDVAYVQLDDAGNYYLPIEPDGLEFCGGYDIDVALYHYLEALCQEEIGCSIHTDSDMIAPAFLSSCQKFKENLSKRIKQGGDKARFSELLPPPNEGILRTTVYKSQFKEIVIPIIDQTIHKTKAMIERIKEEDYDIDTILLIGGSSQLPFIHEKLQVVLPIPPSKTMEVDTAVSMGAAAYGFRKYLGGQKDPGSVELMRLFEQADQLMEEGNEQEGFDKMYKLALDGYSRAQLEVGGYYYIGKVVRKDMDNAFKWVEKAADQDDKAARATLGWLYIQGEGCLANPDLGLSLIQESVESQDGLGYLFLAYCYAEGKAGLDQDLEKSFELAKLSAEAGESQGQVFLGGFYYDGIGVEVDYRRAEELFLAAGEKRNAEGFVWLGKLYLEVGPSYNHVPDKAKGLEWLEMAVRKKNLNAMYYLGNLYLTDGIMEKDVQRAYDYFLMAATLDHAPSQTVVGAFHFHGMERDANVEEAKRWFEKAAEQKNADAIYWLGKLEEIKFDEGAEEDRLKQAVKSYEEAVNLGSSTAMVNLGDFYYIGKGVEKDFDKAFQLYSRAAQLEDDEAIIRVGNCCYFGNGVKESEERALRQYKKAAKLGNASGLDIYLINTGNKLLAPFGFLDRSDENVHEYCKDYYKNFEVGETLFVFRHRKFFGIGSPGVNGLIIAANGIAWHEGSENPICFLNWNQLKYFKNKIKIDEYNNIHLHPDQPGICVYSKETAKALTDFISKAIKAKC